MPGTPVAEVLMTMKSARSTNKYVFSTLALALLGCLVAPQPARADKSRIAKPVKFDDTWSLAEKESWKRIYGQIHQYTNLANASCGTKLVARYDHEAFRDRLAATDANHNEDWSAGAMVTEVRNICLSGQNGRQAVATKIKRIVFVRGRKKSHRLSKGTLEVKLDLRANPRKHINDFKAWLKTKL